MPIYSDECNPLFSSIGVGPRGNGIYLSGKTYEYQQSKVYTCDVSDYETEQRGTIHNLRIGDIVVFKTSSGGVSRFNIGIVNLVSADRVTFTSRAELNVGTMQDLADGSVTRDKISPRAVGSNELDSTGVNSGSYGDTLDRTPNFGSVFMDVSFTVDEDGRITRAGQHTVKIPDTLMSTTQRGIAKVGAGLKMYGDTLQLDGNGDIAAAVTAWLNAHPEATTTVQDNSITTAKLADGAVTDSKLAQSGGVLDKVADLKSAFNNYGIDEFFNPIDAFRYTELYRVSTKILSPVAKNQDNYVVTIVETTDPIAVEVGETYKFFGKMQALQQPSVYTNIRLRVYFLDENKSVLSSTNLGVLSDSGLVLKITNGNTKYISLALFWEKVYGDGVSLTETFCVDLLLVKDDISLNDHVEIKQADNIESGILQFDESNMDFGDRYTPDPTTKRYARNIVTNEIPIAVNYTTQIVANSNFRFRIYKCTDTGTYIDNSDSDWRKTFTVYAGEYLYIKIIDDTKTASEWTTVEACLENVYMIQPWSYSIGQKNRIDQIVPNDECYCANNTFRKMYNPYKNGGLLTLTGQLHCHVKQSDGTSTYTPQDLADKLYEFGYDFFTITDYARFGIVNPPSDLHGMVWLFNSYEANYGPWANDDTYGDDIGEHLITWNARSRYFKENTGYTNVQEVIDWSNDNNCIVSYPHPYDGQWFPQPATKANKILHGLRFCEVYNGATIQSRPELINDYSCENMWKALLKKGNFTFAIGASDAHDLLEYQNKNGVIKVFAEEKTRESILKSLLEGNFYVSSYSGYSMGSVRVEDGKYKINTAHSGASVKFFNENGTELLSATGENVEYTFNGTEKLVWARVEHPAPTYAKFWTQPVFFMDRML